MGAHKVISQRSRLRIGTQVGVYFYPVYAGDSGTFGGVSTPLLPGPDEAGSRSEALVRPLQVWSATVDGKRAAWSPLLKAVSAGKGSEPRDSTVKWDGAVALLARGDLLVPGGLQPQTRWASPEARSAAEYGAAVVLVGGVIVGVGISAGKWGMPAVLALGLLIPLLVWLRQRPQRGVILLVALVPFDGLRLMSSSLPSSVSAWKEVLVLAVLAATFVAPAQARRAPDIRRFPGWAPAVAGLLVLAFGSALIQGGSQAISGFRIDYFYVLLAVAVWRCPLSDKEKSRVVTTLMVTGILTSIVGIIQQLMGQARLHALGYPYNKVIITANGHLRSFSTFASNFEFAFFLMVVIVACLPCALADTRRPRNFVFLASLPLFAVALLFTYTRGAWLGLAVGGMYLALKRYRLLLVAVPVVLLAFLFLPGSIATTSFSSSSLNQRTAGWQQHFDEVVSHPFGLGIGASGAAAQKAAQLANTGQNIQTGVPGTPTYQPDNWYYQALYDLGVLGLWLWILLLASAFATASYVARSTVGFESGFALGVAASLLAAVAASFVTTYFEGFPVNVLFWLQITVVASGPPASAALWWRSSELPPVSAQDDVTTLFIGGPR
jgi:hypothetical protein